MRIVVDTNVLVSGVLSAGGPPGWIVEAILAGDIEPVFDSAILAEYEDVLMRKELRLSPVRVVEILAAVRTSGTTVSVAPWPLKLPDPDDAPFLAVASFAECTLVTGNLKHFPARSRGGVKVLSPRQFLESYAAGMAG
jgi:uncharacterized protein